MVLDKTFSKTHKIILALILIALLLRVPTVLTRFFDPDEFEHLHAARNIYHGMVPYKDFFEHHTPFFHFFLASFYVFLGDKIALIFLARFVMLVFTGVILYLTFRLARLLYDSNVALLATLFLSYVLMFQKKTIEIRPDVPALLFWLLALFFFISGIKIQDEQIKKVPGKYFLASGLLMASAILTTQKAFFAAMGLLIASVFILFKRKAGNTLKERVSLIAWFSLGLFIPFGITYLYFLKNGAWADFVYRNFTMNLYWKTSFTPFYYIKQLIIQNPFFSLLSLLGLIAAIVQLFKAKKMSGSSLVMLFSTGSLLLGLFIIPVPYRQYFLFFLPLLAIYCGFIFDKLVNYFFKGNQHLFTLALLSVILINPFINMVKTAVSNTNQGQLKEIKFILQNTNSEDTVFDGWRGTGVFRNHAYYYYFLHPEIQRMLTPKELSGDIIKALSDKKTKFVIYDNYIHFLPVAVNNYLQNNYQSTGIGQIYVLKTIN